MRRSLMSCRRSWKAKEKKRSYPVLGFDTSFAELSPLGDSIANLIYSLALSRALGRVVGRKVSNSILAEAVVKAGLRERAGTRVDKHKLGDFAESLLAQAFLQGALTLEECVALLEDKLRGAREGELRAASVAAFAALLAQAGNAIWEEG